MAQLVNATKADLDRYSVCCQRLTTEVRAAACLWLDIATMRAALAEWAGEDPQRIRLAGWIVEIAGDRHCFKHGRISKQIEQGVHEIAAAELGLRLRGAERATALLTMGGE